jgi:hypothetical protein
MGLAPARGRIKAEYLFKDLVVIQAHEKGTAKGQKNDDGEASDYTWVRGTIAVLEGPVSDELETVLGHTELPVVLEDVKIQEAAVTAEIAHKAGQYDEDGTPKLTVGRVAKYTNGKGGTSYKLAESLAPEDLQKAIKYVAANPGVFPEKDPFEAEEKAAKAFA